MNGQGQPEIQKFDPKIELERTRIQLHNLKMHEKLLEVQIKKLEELSR